VINKETGQPVIDPETGEVKMREVSNRRIAVDSTFGVPKSVSMRLALTHDVEAEQSCRRAMRKTLDDMEKAIQTRVRTAGADHDRTTGNAIVACFGLYLKRRLTRRFSAWMRKATVQQNHYSLTLEM
jgi:conjugative relaxase-like TrwC/TraI family protein